jgi:hypothetical protein
MAALLYADRVKDTTTTTGTGNITLAGSPPTGYQSFNAAFSTTYAFYYCIEGGAEWEVGRGHLSASTTLVRDTVTASSNAGAAVNFSAGTKNVFCTEAARVANPWITVVKPSTTNRNTTTTLTDDPHLTFPVLASTQYIVRAAIYAFVPATPDLKFTFATPTLTALQQDLRYGSNLTVEAVSRANTFAASTTLVAAGTQYAVITLNAAMLIAGSGGTFSFQWSQNTSDANDVAIIVGSYLEYMQL